MRLTKDTITIVADHIVQQVKEGVKSRNKLITDSEEYKNPIQHFGENIDNLLEQLDTYEILQEKKRIIDVEISTIKAEIQEEALKRFGMGYFYHMDKENILAKINEFYRSENFELECINESKLEVAVKMRIAELAETTDHITDLKNTLLNEFAHKKDA